MPDIPFSLTNMARENSKEMNRMLAYRLYDELVSILNEPIIVSKTMSDNTLLVDFLKNEDTYTEEKAISIMKDYLETIRSKFGMMRQMLFPKAAADTTRMTA